MSHFITVLFTLLIKTVSILFLVGITGTVSVLLMTFWEDLKTLSGKT